MKFVVVDDEEVNLIIASRLLLNVLNAKDVQTYRNGGEALRFLQNYNGSETISLFLDLNMPVVSGWDFLEFFNEFDDHLKSRVHIYIVSSSIEPDNKTKALANPNIISFVPKPLTAAFLTSNFSKMKTNKTGS